MILFEAVVDIKGDMTKYQIAVNKTRRNFATNISKMNSLVQKHSQQIRKMGRAFTIAGGVITGALLGMVAKATSMGDQLDKMSLRTGIAVEELSKLGYAANITGTNIDTIEKGLRFLARSMDDMSRGIGEGKETFEKMGIVVTKVDGSLRSVTDVMREAAEKIAVMTNETEKVAAATDLFGSRFGTALLPMLKLGSAGIKQLTDRAEELGLVISTEAASAAAVFNDRLTELKTSLAMTAAQIGNVLIPVLEPLVERLTEIIGAITKWTTAHPGLTKSIATFAGVIGGLMLAGGPLLMFAPTLLKIGAAAVTLKAKLILLSAELAAFAASVWMIVRIHNALTKEMDGTEFSLKRLAQQLRGITEWVRKLEAGLEAWSKVGDPVTATLGDMSTAVNVLNKETGLSVTANSNAAKVLEVLKQSIIKTGREITYLSTGVVTATGDVGGLADEADRLAKALAALQDMAFPELGEIIPQSELDKFAKMAQLGELPGTRSIVIDIDVSMVFDKTAKLEQGLSLLFDQIKEKWQRVFHPAKTAEELAKRLAAIDKALKEEENRLGAFHARTEALRDKDHDSNIVAMEANIARLKREQIGYSKWLEGYFKSAAVKKGFGDWQKHQEEWEDYVAGSALNITSIWETTWKVISDTFGNTVESLRQNFSNFISDTMTGIGKAEERWEKFATNTKQIFADVFADMLTNFAVTVAEMVAKWLWGQAAMLAATLATGLKEIAIYTAKAAAAAYSAIAGIPVVGPILAPIAAVATIAGVAAVVASVPGFAEGGLTPSRPTLAILHPDEAVIPLSGGKVPVEMSGSSGGNTFLIHQYFTHANLNDITDEELQNWTDHKAIPAMMNAAARGL